MKKSKTSGLSATEKAVAQLKKRYGFVGTVIFVLIFLVIILLAIYFSPYFKNENLAGDSGNVVTDGLITNDLRVHFIDVNQGDATLIQTPNNMNILIDAGDTDRESKTKLLNYLDSLEIEIIDYVIATHTDSDHIGGFPEIFEEYKINYVFRPYLYSDHNNSEKFEDTFNISAAKPCSTKIYSTFLNSIYDEKSEWTYFNKDTDLVINLTDTDGKVSELRFDFLSPTNKLADIIYSDMNDYSPIIKMSYNEIDFMFTGDAGIEVEEEVINAYQNFDLDVEILKVGHHGSDTSSSMSFLQKIKPEYSVISCGKGNSYKHPKQSVLTSLLYYSQIFRTDLQGNIIFTVDSEGKISPKVSTECLADDLFIGY